MDIKTITIGEQEWMASNLEVETFRNGDNIAEIESDEDWISAGKEGIPAWCYYENDPKNGDKYGKLYNWYAVNDERGICPENFHIPSDDEWKELGYVLDMEGMECDESIGAEILKKALEGPIRQIIINAGLDFISPNEVTTLFFSGYSKI